MIAVKNNTFHISTRRTSYLFGVDEQGNLLHWYYGARIHEDGLAFRDFARTTTWSVYAPDDEEHAAPLQCTPYEYFASGYGTFYPGSCSIRNEAGHNTSRLLYRSAELVKMAEVSTALPRALNPDEVFKVTLEDPINGLQVVLYYEVFSECDIIVRSAVLKNNGTQTLRLDRAMSLTLHLGEDSFDLIRLCGRWAHERSVIRTPVGQGTLSIGSLNGESSHEVNPFFALARPHTTNMLGEVYGFNLIYSGNWKAEVYCDSYGALHIQEGIHPESFLWTLRPGEMLETPQAVCTYAENGLNTMSGNFHRFIRRHISRGYWKDRKRPLLINSWETTYFDFDEASLVRLAKSAKELGVEMLVLDDGWFSTRNSDHSGLGDWTVNTNKLPGGLGCLSERIHQEGMQFGLWFEPEMVNPDSDLYRAHPEWIIAAQEYPAPLCRNQFVLDFSNPAVVDYIFESMCRILDSARIEYVKWDMNRPLTCLGSTYLDADRQGELAHRYVLGVYELLQRLTKRYPKLLIEGCSGGGGRFDLGMLCYCPQIWCSDNTDPFERLVIQNGTSYAYPVAAMGCHVSASPNHYTKRASSLEMRAAVAMPGSFGYELDLGVLSDEEKQQIRAQIGQYHKTYECIHNGTYYRLSEPGQRDFAAWQFVAEDGCSSLITVVFLKPRRNLPAGRLRLCGLEEQAAYRCGEENVLYGDALMNFGLDLGDPAQIGEVRTYYFEKQNTNKNRKED